MVAGSSPVVLAENVRVYVERQFSGCQSSAPTARKEVAPRRCARPARGCERTFRPGFLHALAQIEREGRLGAYEIMVKTVPAQRAILARDVADRSGRLNELSRAVGELMLRQGLHDAAPWLHIHYDPDWRELGEEIGAAVMVDTSPEDAAQSERGTAAFTLLPAVETMAAVVHRGPADALVDAYVALGAWLEANNYTIVGPCREIFLSWSPDGDSVIEVQFPVEKAK